MALRSTKRQTTTRQETPSKSPRTDNAFVCVLAELAEAARQRVAAEAAAAAAAVAARQREAETAAAAAQLQHTCSTPCTPHAVTPTGGVRYVTSGPYARPCEASHLHARLYRGDCTRCSTRERRPGRAKCDACGRDGGGDALPRGSVLVESPGNAVLPPGNAVPPAMISRYNMAELIRFATAILGGHTGETPDTLSEQPLLASARGMWKAALALIHKGDARATHTEAASALLTLSRWRLHSCRRKCDPLCAFVATCALRMVILDVSAPFMSRVVERCHEIAQGDSLDPTLAGLLLREAEALAPFEPPKSLAVALGEVVDASRAWNEAEFTSWARSAYAVTFSEVEEPADESDPSPVTMKLDDAALETLAQFDVDCTHRHCLRVLLSNATPAAPDPRIDAVTDWVVRCTRAANDEVFAMGREAVSFCFQTPKSARRGTGAWSRRLTDWDPEWAVEAHDASRPGFQLLQDGGDPSYLDSLVLHYFDYSMRQRYDLRFWDLFVVTDYTPEETNSSLEVFKTEKMRRPPPKLVLSLKEWYLVYRTDAPGGFARIVR